MKMQMVSPTSRRTWTSSTARFRFLHRRPVRTIFVVSCSIPVSLQAGAKRYNVAADNVKDDIISAGSSSSSSSTSSSLWLSSTDERYQWLSSERTTYASSNIGSSSSCGRLYAPQTEDAKADADSSEQSSQHYCKDSFQCRLPCHELESGQKDRCAPAEVCHVQTGAAGGRSFDSPRSSSSSSRGASKIKANSKNRHCVARLCEEVRWSSSTEKVPELRRRIRICNSAGDEGSTRHRKANTNKQCSYNIHSAKCVSGQKLSALQEVFGGDQIYSGDSSSSMMQTEHQGAGKAGRSEKAGPAAAAAADQQTEDTDLNTLKAQGSKLFREDQQANNSQELPEDDDASSGQQEQTNGAAVVSPGALKKYLRIAERRFKNARVEFDEAEKRLFQKTLRGMADWGVACCTYNSLLGCWGSCSSPINRIHIAFISSNTLRRLLQDAAEEIGLLKIELPRVHADVGHFLRRQMALSDTGHVAGNAALTLRPDEQRDWDNLKVGWNVEQDVPPSTYPDTTPPEWGTSTGLSSHERAASSAAATTASELHDVEDAKSSQHLPEQEDGTEMNKQAIKSWYENDGETPGKAKDRPAGDEDREINIKGEEDAGKVDNVNQEDPNAPAWYEKRNEDGTFPKPRIDPPPSLIEADSRGTPTPLDSNLMELEQVLEGEEM
ncbi:unnamed protein product [Amoebophrya sp. A25]|nr:unnamed protein product [Amoebophrya sp. A25]|eukprot:GSA25T00023146001.1